MTTMKKATANSANARQRLMFGVSRTGLSAIVITASYALSLVVVITSVGVGTPRNSATNFRCPRRL
jgi:uncharacterized membrane protein YhfC